MSWQSLEPFKNMNHHLLEQACSLHLGPVRGLKVIIDKGVRAKENRPQLGGYCPGYHLWVFAADELLHMPRKMFAGIERFTMVSPSMSSLWEYVPSS